MALYVFDETNRSTDWWRRTNPLHVICNALVFRSKAKGSEYGEITGCSECRGHREESQDFGFKVSQHIDGETHFVPKPDGKD